MKYIFLIIQLNLISAFLPKTTEPNLCVNCKFFEKEFLMGNDLAKCSLFPRKERNDDFLVDGIKRNKKIEYSYCSVSRMFDDMCGKEGKLFQKKLKRKNFFHGFTKENDE